MKHTTFENELRDIRRNAINELKRAVDAHGLKYEWTYRTSPLLSHKVKCMGIYKMTDEDTKMFGLRCELFVRPFNDDEDNVYIENLPIEDVLAITEAIPETDEVKDVSGVYPLPVTWVDLDDVENAGFDTKGLTQADLDAIQDEMAESYLNYGFNEDLRNACEYYGLKEKED